MKVVLDTNIFISGIFWTGDSYKILDLWRKHNFELITSIEIIEDPQIKVSGPIWVKGGIDLESADGTKYERRNRMTLCRCGKSNNKPFCDGSHINVRFNDGDESLI